MQTMTNTKNALPSLSSIFGNKKNVATAKKIAFTLAAAALIGLMLAAPDASIAGGGGSEFDDVWNTLKDWTQGTLGRIVSGAFILVGIIGGIARQSLMAFALGVGGGMGLYNSPTIVESIMSATLPTAMPAVVQICNGLGC